MKKLLVCLMILLAAGAAFGQNNTLDSLLTFSAPGKQHALLGRLAGKWSFQDAKRAFVKGTLVRTAMYAGRFYQVEITGGKLSIPVGGGKMTEANYSGLQIEGYDNVKAAYVTVALNNHIGSDIEMQLGTCDAQEVFTYECTDELLPGQKVSNRRIVRMLDADHYVEEYFELRNGAAVKVRELDYTRVAQ